MHCHYMCTHGSRALNVEHQKVVSLQWQEQGLNTERERDYNVLASQQV